MKQKKRPTLGTSNLEELIAKTAETHNEYDATADVDLHKGDVKDFRKEV